MKIAGAQIDVSLGNIEANLAKIVRLVAETASNGAKLTVFPECALAGYCFGSLQEARPFAQSIPGPATETIARACRESGSYVVFGMLEADGERVFNATALVGPAGFIASYRKVHLPYLGVDMHTTYGDRPFAVHPAGELNVGMNICYDAAFPEAARTLAILGADLIVLPTNWPPGAQCTADCTINSRAMENGVYYMAVNRVGTERSFAFIGRSRICDPSGRTLADAPHTQEAIFYADVDPAKARNKHVIRVPGKYEIDRLADRRPEMYHVLTQSHSLQRPGRGPSWTDS